MDLHLDNLGFTAMISYSSSLTPFETHYPFSHNAVVAELPTALRCGLPLSSTTRVFVGPKDLKEDDVPTCTLPVNANNNDRPCNLCRARFRFRMSRIHRDGAKDQIIIY